MEGKKLLDLGCGTGEMLTRFASLNYDVCGVDLSPDMLTVAREKMEREGFRIPLYEQNMVQLELIEQYDIIGIFCDSLNYLTTEEEILQTFQQVYKYLQDDGLFIFDVHSLYKMNEIFMNNIFTYDEDSIYYIWHCFPGEQGDSVEHELTFFVKENGETYRRYDEFHIQRTFSPEIYTHILNKANFELLEMNEDVGGKVFDQEQAERIHFVARKMKSTT